MQPSLCYVCQRWRGLGDGTSFMQGRQVALIYGLLFCFFRGRESHLSFSVVSDWTDQPYSSDAPRRPADCEKRKKREIEKEMRSPFSLPSFCCTCTDRHTHLCAHTRPSLALPAVPFALHSHPPVSPSSA